MSGEGHLDQHNPNKFVPVHHEPFPQQTNHGHGTPGDNKNLHHAEEEDVE